MLMVSINFGQTAFQFTGEDCNGSPVDLYADLDAGKAVVLFYYMPDCGACPPPAQEIQDMANNVMNTYPEMVKGYTFPFLDSYTCESVVNWVDESHVPFYTPMDSGAYQVAYYGGFGMPTVVLVGGEDHRVLFSTLSYFTSDTTIMRDSILRLFGEVSDVFNLNGVIAQMEVYPNPAQVTATVEVYADVQTDVVISLMDATGRTVYTQAASALMPGRNAIQLDVSAYEAGMYHVRVSGDDGYGVRPILIIK